MEKSKPDTIQFNELGKFGEAGTKLGKLVDTKQEAYGDSVQLQWEVTQVLLKKYETDESGTHYLIPKSLMRHLLLITRIGDKINRIVSNPDGDKMGESPYGDIAGYGLLGNNMMSGSDEFDSIDNIESKSILIKKMGKLINLTFIINGKESILFDINVEYVLANVIKDAMRVSGHEISIDNPLWKWQVRINDIEMEINKQVKAFDIKKDDKIFISSKAGVGGTN